MDADTRIINNKIITTMREIKFRGRTSKGEWLYGDLQQWSNGDVYIGTQNETWTDDGFPHTDNYLSITKVNENTVGQFTGLHDKNGKEIYEGDIVTIGNSGIIFRIAWHKYLAQFYYAFLIDGEQKKNDRNANIIEMMEEYPIEVIGNIHDNHELLKGGEK